MIKGQKSVRGGIEDFLMPVTDLYITQGSGGSFSHRGTMANDIRGSESGVRYPYYAPCDCKLINRILSNGQGMWQSLEKVRFSNGNIDYATFVTCHDETFDAQVGQIVKQGAQLGNMGTKGNGVTGVHVHIEVAQHKYDMNNWKKNSYGIYCFPNETDTDDCFFVDNTNILNGMGGNWRTTDKVPVEEEKKSKYGTPVGRDTSINQIKINADNVRARSSANGAIIGYMNTGLYNSLEIVNANGYNWHRVEDGLWFANGDWCDWLPKEEVKPNTIGTPVSRNTNVDQIEIIGTVVRARKSAGGELYGSYVNPGIYNIKDESQKEDYLWINIEGDIWCAYSSDWATLYRKGEEPKPEVNDYTLKGIDISHYQETINLSKVDCDFVIMKATEGVGYKDPAFDNLYTQAKTNNKKLGIYHLCRPDLGNSAQDEANWFIETTQKYFGEAMLILDIEPKYLNIEWATKWLEIIESISGVKPILYIGDNMEEVNDWSSLANKYDIWLASYRNTKPDTTYWKSYLMWQYTSEGKLDGYKGNLDLNYFYGKDWETYIKKSEPIPEPIDDKDKKIEELQSQVNLLELQIKDLNAQIEELKKNDNCLYTKLINKTDLYAIHLNEGETIIIKATN